MGDLHTSQTCRLRKEPLHIYLILDPVAFSQSDSLQVCFVFGLIMFTSAYSYLGISPIVSVAYSVVFSYRPRFITVNMFNLHLKMANDMGNKPCYSDSANSSRQEFQLSQSGRGEAPVEINFCLPIPVQIWK